LLLYGAAEAAPFQIEFGRRDGRRRFKAEPRPFKSNSAVAMVAGGSKLNHALSNRIRPARWSPAVQS
jgi:hypothetical protein